MNGVNADIDLPNDEAALRRMRAVAHLLDDGFRLPGTDFRFGIDPILSLAPGNAGDLIGTGLSLYIVYEAANLGVPYSTIVRMLTNVAADAVVGSVPIVGAIFDAVFKANVRNVRLVERHLGREHRDDGDDSEPVRIEITE
ncbi:DUF4112 domain-containing protein [Halomarina pelagica]|uniref:DUF4112 domain-containing protein n=1 Tax=Halomarina pelagica TaxID=2961599 RepID=UPI0020C2D612|nr:DUF4112 domain-containing protein [Halomarina sp. BND7]